jgi:hypothetical protein
LQTNLRWVEHRARPEKGDFPQINKLGGVIMTWNLECKDDLQIVVLTYSGKVSGRDIKEAAAARIDMGKQKGITRFLIDTRKVEADESATMGIHEIPAKMYPEKQVERTNRIAIIGPESSISKTMVRFFENSCVNRGWLVSAFQDYKSAIEYLGLSCSQQKTERDK